MLNTGERIFTDNSSGSGGGGGATSTTYHGTAAGTNTYTTTIAGIASYAQWLTVQLLFTNGNTGASTININGLGAKTLVNFGNAALVSGDIKAGQILTCIYDGTNFQIQSVTDNIVNAI
jgi:hypothetical protein